MSDQMYRVALASRPVGAPKAENFSYESAPVPEPGEGEVLVRVHYMSLDPYMRGRMDDAKSYAAPVPIGGTMEGGGVGEVIASNSDRFKPGDFAMGRLGWTTHAVQPGDDLQRVDPAIAPITTTLGVLGMPGFTGWYGLNKIGKPRAGETLVVAAATGPVGSMVGQLAKSYGLRAVGVAGGAVKCNLATDTFGFDACLDHRAFDDAKPLRSALRDACPDGIDIYFENVGGKVFEAVFPLINAWGRLPICGRISQYNKGGLGANAGPADDGLSVSAVFGGVLVKFLSVQGFIISNHYDLFGEFISEVGPKVANGEIKYLEDIAEGLENAPEAFMGLLQGKNVGKQIVKVI